MSKFHPLAFFLTYLMVFFFSRNLTHAQETGTSPIDIGTRLELMVDDHLFGVFMGGARQRLHHPVPREIAIKHDAPWEGNKCAYHTVFSDGDVYRMYYRGAQYNLENNKIVQGHQQVTCYAESKDGIIWEKPNLKLFEFEGSKENNIIWASGRTTHNFAPFKDANPNAADDQRYKAFAYPETGPKSISTFASPDGIHWRLLSRNPVITKGRFDSQNNAFWDEVREEYRAYYRDFRDGFRDIRMATSKDFINWSEGQWLDYGDAAREHFIY